MRTRAKVLAAILCTVAALTTSGGTYVSASSEAADAKTEVRLDFPVMEILLTRVPDLVIQVHHCFLIW